MPPVVRNKARLAGAGAWLDELPALIAALEQDWDITAGRPFADPTEAYVARARLGDGTPAVLKLMIPRPGDHAQREITTLRLAGGEGCARLLRSDVARGALLTERLGRSMYQLALPLERRLEILCDAAARLWRPVAGTALPTGRDHARQLAASITARWDQLGRPCSERTVEHALACAARRGEAHDDDRAVLVHGDVHQWNALQAGAGFKLVDPDGLRAEPECDLGVLMREDPVELLTGDARDRARWLARRTGRDATAIWEWGAADRVCTGLVLTGIGLQPVAGQMLAAADHVAGLALP